MTRRLGPEDRGHAPLASNEVEGLGRIGTQLLETLFPITLQRAGIVHSYETQGYPANRLERLYLLEDLLGGDGSEVDCNAVGPFSTVRSELEAGNLGLVQRELSDVRGANARLLAQEPIRRGTFGVLDEIAHRTPSRLCRPLQELLDDNALAATSAADKEGEGPELETPELLINRPQSRRGMGYDLNARSPALDVGLYFLGPLQQNLSELLHCQPRDQPVRSAAVVWPEP